MPFSSALQTIGTPAIATPQDVAILSSVPGIATVVRNDAQRLIACNPAYALASGSSVADLLETTPSERLSNPCATERSDLMKSVIKNGSPRDFLQFWDGRAWLCRLIPLDADSYGFHGTLSIVMQAPIGTTRENSGVVHVLQTANFGTLAALTPAEKRTMYDLAMGRSNNEIAQHRERSVRTIECHVRAIHEKLDTSSRSAIVRDASQRGIQLFSSEQWEAMIDADQPGKPARPGSSKNQQPAMISSSEIEPKDSAQTASDGGSDH